MQPDEEGFDVFLCHNTADKPAVKAIAERLHEHELRPWLDEWELRPGLPWQEALETQIENIRTAGVFVGECGLGPWQTAELAAFLRQFTKRKCPVIPVILPGCATTPKLPVFLRGNDLGRLPRGRSRSLRTPHLGHHGRKPVSGSSPKGDRW